MNKTSVSQHREFYEMTEPFHFNNSTYYMIRKSNSEPVENAFLTCNNR